MADERDAELWLVRHGETEWSRDGRHTSTTDLDLTDKGVEVEWDYGDYEGVTTAEIRETVPGWTVWTHPTPGGETAQQVSTRLDRVVERAQNAGARVLVFGHGHSLRALTARWIEQPVDEGRFFKLDTATVSTLGYERDFPVVLRWNS
jgi:broad specificity phosphatase PhoE